VRIQTQTIVRAMLKESSSAPVKRPQMPNEILLQKNKIEIFIFKNIILNSKF
jgi:hypothetical protein